MARKALFVFIGFVFISSVSWANPPGEEVVQYYQVLKKAPAEINTFGLAFGEKLREAIAEGNPDKIAKMKIALVDILLNLHRVKEETKAINIISSPGAKDLYDAVENYLRQQEKSIFDSGPEIIRIAADAALTPIDKKNRVKEIIDQNRKGAAAVESPLTKALMAFARENDLVGEPTLEFNDFTTPDNSCKVQMPAFTENKTSETNGVKNSYYLVEHKYGLFMLSYADIAEAGEGEEKIQKRLDDARTGLIKKLNLTITKESALTLDGKYPGREVEGNMSDQSSTRIRLFLVEGRLYQMWVVGNPAWAVSAEATRFLKSFALVK